MPTLFVEAVAMRSQYESIGIKMFILAPLCHICFQRIFIRKYFWRTNPVSDNIVQFPFQTKKDLCFCFQR